MKKTTSSVLGFTLAGVLALLLPARVQAQAPQYTVTILSNPGGYNDSQALGINASGQVVGTWTSSGTSFAVVWNGTTPTVLTGLGLGTSGRSINAFGQVAGFATTSSGNYEAVVWNGTTPTLLNSVGGSTQTQAFGINASGQVAGTSNNEAVVWNGTAPTVLSVLNAYSYAYAINVSGQVAGYAITSGGAYEAVVWNGTTPTVLTGVSSPFSGGGSFAYAINASGKVVGSSDTSFDGVTDAVEWNGTTPTVLGTFGGSQSIAYSINASGQVVGDSQTTGNASDDGFLYTGGTMYDLNSILVPGSGVTGISASSINDLGQIAGNGIYEGESVAVVLTPQLVPEPTSAVLLVSGAALLGLRRRRARRCSAPTLAVFRLSQAFRKANVRAKLRATAQKPICVSPKTVTPKTIE